MSIDHISSAAPDASSENHIPDPVREPIEAPSPGKKKLALAVLGAFVLLMMLVFLVVKFSRDKLHGFSEDRAAAQAEKKSKSSGSPSARQAIDFSNLSAAAKSTEKAVPSTAATPVPLAGKGQSPSPAGAAPQPQIRPSMMSDVSAINAPQPTQNSANLPRPPEPPKPPISPQELLALINQSKSPSTSTAA